MSAGTHRLAEVLAVALDDPRTRVAQHSKNRSMEIIFISVLS